MRHFDGGPCVDQKVPLLCLGDLWLTQLGLIQFSPETLACQLYVRRRSGASFKIYILGQA